MPVVDIPNRTITLKIVYYGCARGGKTTNLIMLQRLTDPANAQGMVSIATKDDRTLFFDLLPVSLGQIGGLNIKCKLYTVPGQVHYEVTRRQVLAGADGVVLVVDSAPAEKKANQWAFENMRMNLRSSRIDPDTVPTALQWNKRDLPGARSLADLQADLNTARLPAVEAVAVQGNGVVQTFATILKATVKHCYKQVGRSNVAESTIDQTIDRSLLQVAVNEPRPPASVQHQFDHRFDMDSYRDEQAEQGHARQIVDQESLLGESVKASMALAESLDGYGLVSDTGERRKNMMHTLGGLVARLIDPNQAALPAGALARLLESTRRRRGSVLLFKQGAEIMEEHEVSPSGGDLLNGTVAAGLGSLAFRMSRENHVRVIEDLGTEVFYGAPPPETADVGSALIAPMACDGTAFGSVIAYTRVSEPAFDDTEIEFWTTASTLIGLALHWRALRKKVLRQVAS